MRNNYSNKVALQQCYEYDFDKVYASIQSLMELVPPPDVKGKTVLLKPNILYPKKPELAVCTHPVVVGAVTKAFVSLGAKKVMVGESPAIAGSESSAKQTGMYDMVVANGGEWADFTDKVSIDLPEGKIKKQFDVAKQFTEADVVVSLCKLKSHQFMSYTGAMKNLFGMILGLEKAKTHYLFPKKEDFAAYITDLNVLIDADYSIMDAIVGMEGPGGPGSGDPIALNFLAASDNILALDIVCCRAVGYNPLEITYIKDALERQLWFDVPTAQALEKIQTVGCTEDAIRNKNFKAVHDGASSDRVWKIVFASELLAKKPHFMNDKCIRCGRCVKICPPQVLSFVDDKSKYGKHVEINRKDCIKCFCCHEICPADAIKLRRF